MDEGQAPEHIKRAEIVDSLDVGRLLNHTALRDMQIRSFWEGLSHTGWSRVRRIDVVCDRFSTGFKNVERIVSDI